jgi:hypothetical protein
VLRVALEAVFQHGRGLALTANERVYAMVADMMVIVATFASTSTGNSNITGNNTTTTESHERYRVPQIYFVQWKFNGRVQQITEPFKKMRKNRKGPKIVTYHDPKN